MALSTRRVVLAEGVQELSDGTFDNVIIQLVAGRAANILVATIAGDITGTDIGHVLAPNSTPVASFTAFMGSGQRIFAKTPQALVGSILAITEY